MRVRGRIPVILSGVVVATTIAIASACSQPGSLPAGPSALGGSTEAGASSPLSATVRFGNDSVGSKFPPPSGHDNSGHARDNLIPRTAVIDQGGTVTFVMGGPVHQVAIYDDGTTPEQVSRQPTVLKPKCPPVPFITGAGDPNLIAVLGEPMCAGGASQVSYTFTEPGRYLVICSFLPHFNMNMYGWVEVRARP